MTRWLIGWMATMVVLAVCVQAQEAAQPKILRHVVLFRFKEGTPPEKIKETEQAFCALPGKISEIKGFEWGTDLKGGKSAEGFTHCFVVTFNNEEDLKTYGSHPDHQAFSKALKPYLDKCHVIDYWVGK